MQYVQSPVAIASVADIELTIECVLISLTSSADNIDSDSNAMICHQHLPHIYDALNLRYGILLDAWDKVDVTLMQLVGMVRERMLYACVEVPNPGELRKKIFAAIQEHLGIDHSDIDTSLSFNDMNIDSLTAALIAGEISDAFGINVGYDEITKFNSILDMENYLTARLTRTPHQ